MIVVVDGKAYNSEDSVISVLVHSNERGNLGAAMAQGHDIFNCYPLDTKEIAIKKNSDKARDVNKKLAEVRGDTDPGKN